MALSVLPWCLRVHRRPAGLPLPRVQCSPSSWSRKELPFSHCPSVQDDPPPHPALVFLPRPESGLSSSRGTLTDNRPQTPDLAATSSYTVCQPQQPSLQPALFLSPCSPSSSRNPPSQQPAAPTPPGPRSPARPRPPAPSLAWRRRHSSCRARSGRRSRSVDWISRSQRTRRS